MRYWLLIVAAGAAIALTVSQAANAWHAADAQAAATCLNGTYNVTATVTQSGQWPGAFVKSVTPATLPGTTTGTTRVTIVVGWPNSSERQTFYRDVQTAGNCRVVCEPVTIVKEVRVEVPVEKVVEKRVEVPVEKVVYVDRVVEKVVEKPVTKTVYVIRYKTRWKTRTVVKHVYHTKVIHDRCPPPKVCCEGKG